MLWDQLQQLDNLSWPPVGWKSGLRNNFLQDRVALVAIVVVLQSGCMVVYLKLFAIHPLMVDHHLPTSILVQVGVVVH